MFISQQMDVWIPKYENDVLERPRRAILVGTTNEREYLKGEHGNTRYLPVWLDGPIQHAALAAVRDRLFTQAKHFLADHPDDWWAIPEDVEKEVVREREARREPSVFEDVLRPFLLTRQRCSVAEVLTEALHIPEAQWSKRLEMDVTKAFKGLQWHRHIAYDHATKRMARFWANVPQENEGGALLSGHTTFIPPSYHLVKRWYDRYITSSYHHTTSIERFLYIGAGSDTQKRSTEFGKKGGMRWYELILLKLRPRGGMKVV